jgi:hypothetical protein
MRTLLTTLGSWCRGHPEAWLPPVLLAAIIGVGVSLSDPQLAPGGVVVGMVVGVALAALAHIPMPVRVLTSEVAEGVATMVGGIYMVVGLLVGAAAFFAGWIYAVSTWGFFLGGALGWIPALFLAVMAGFAWPLLALAAWGVWQGIL